MEYSIETILNQLQKFKNLPTYQFERRIDAFILPYLEDYLNSYFKFEGTYKMIYPEFPLDAEVPKSNGENSARALYADYLFYNSTTKDMIFLEFKTDVESVKPEQFVKYARKCTMGWPSLLKFYVEKTYSGKYQKKYVAGLMHLNEQAKEILGCKEFGPLPRLLQPGVPGITEHMRGCRFLPPQDISLGFMYLAPAKAKPILETIKRENSISDNVYRGFLDLADFAQNTDEPLRTILKTI